MSPEGSVASPRSSIAWRDSARPALFAGAAVVLVAVIVALVLAVSQAGSLRPAFAATVNTNGTVTITLREFGAIGELNRRLAALGTRIRAVPVVTGCVAPVHTVSNGLVVPGPARTLEAHPLGPIGGALVSETIAVNTIPGRTLVVAETKSGLDEEGVVVVGPAPRCVGEASSASSDQPFLPAR